MSLGALTVKIGADLSDLNRGLNEANRNVQTFGGVVSRNATAPIRQMEGAAGGASFAFKSLKEPLTSVTRQLLELNPAVAKVSGELGMFAIGGGPMIAILAGAAALSIAWKKLTKDADDLAEKTDNAIKSLTALRDKQQLGPLAGTSAREAELAGIRRAQLRDQEKDLIAKVAASAARSNASLGNMTDPVFLKQLVEVQRQITDLTSLIEAHDKEVLAVRDAKEKAEWDKFFSGLSAKMKTGRTEAADLAKGQREYLDFLSERNSVSLPKVGTGMQVAGGPIAGFKFTPEMFTQVGTLQIRAAQALADAAQRQKEAAAAAQAAALKSLAIASVTGLLTQHGGSLGGIAASAISGGLAAGPWGAVIGGGTALISTLLGHRKSVDQNTAALRHLTATINNEPTGFKASAYRYLASDPSAYMRDLNAASDVFASRGGVVFANG